MLMHNCSNEFFLKFSNPKMSRIPTFMPLSTALQRKKRGTNKLILLCDGTSKSPAAILIDKTLMIIQVPPKYGVWSGWPSLTRNHKHRLWKSQIFLNGFYFSLYWFNLQLFSMSALTILTSATQHRDLWSCILYSVLGAATFMISHYPQYVEVTFNQCYQVINGNKETAKMTGMQTGTLASSLRDDSLTVNAHIYEGILLDQWKASLQSLWSLFNHLNIIFSARNSVSKIY